MAEQDLFVPSAAPEKGGLPPQLRVDVEPQAFGVGVAKAKEEQAAELGRVGQKITERAFELQDFNNDAEANQRIIAAGQRLSDARARFLQSQLHDTAAARVTYNNEVAGIYRDSQAQIQNPAVRRKFGDYAARRIERDEEIAATHAATEANKAAKQDRADVHKNITDEAASTVSEVGANTKVISDLAEQAAANASTGAYVTTDPITGAPREINEPTKAAERARSDVIEKSIRTALNNEENGGTQAYELYKHYTDADPKLDKDPVIRHRLLSEIHTKMKEEIAARGAALALKGLPPGTDAYTVQRLEAVDRTWRDVYKQMHDNNPSLEVGVPGLGGPAGFENLLAPIRRREGWDKPNTTFTSTNMAKMLSGETATKWHNEAPNSAGYAGFFQLPVIDPSRPKRHPDAEVTWAQMKDMSFEQQLDLYVRYLKKNGYTGTEHLGVMQGAPAYKDRPDNFLAYPRGSKEAVANPGWQVASGDVTIGGMKRHYDTKSTGFSGDTMKVWPYKDGQPMSKDDPNFPEAFQKVKQAAGVAIQDLKIKGSIDDDGILKYDKGYSTDQYQPPAEDTMEQKIEHGKAAIGAKYPEFKYELQADFERAMLAKQAQHNTMDRIQKYEDHYSMAKYILNATMPNGMSVVDFSDAPPDVRAVVKRVQNDNPEEFRAIQKYATQNLKEGYPSTTATRNYVRKMSEMAQGSDADRQRFLEIMGTREPYDQKLPRSELNQLYVASKEIMKREGKAEDDLVKTIMGSTFVEGLLKKNRWTEHENLDMNLTVKGAIRERIHQLKLDTGKVPSRQEMFEIGRDVLNSVRTVPRGGLLGWMGMNITEPAIKSWVPTTEADMKAWEQKKEELTARFGAVPSKQEVDGAWKAQMELARKRDEGKPKKPEVVPGEAPLEPPPPGAPATPTGKPPAVEKREAAMPSVPSKSLYEREGELVQRFGRVVAAETGGEAEQAREAKGAEMRAIQQEEAGIRGTLRPGTAYREGRLAKIARRRAELEAEETP